MSKTIYELDCLDKKEVEALGADLSKNNEYVTETAGFVPLQVKLKQFEQNGLVAQFSTAEFDSNDYRDIYLNPDFNIYPDDDIEDVNDKLAARQKFILELQEKKAEKAASVANTAAAAAGSQKKDNQPEEKNAD